MLPKNLSIAHAVAQLLPDIAARDSIIFCITKFFATDRRSYFSKLGPVLCRDLLVPWLELRRTFATAPAPHITQCACGNFSRSALAAYCDEHTSDVLQHEIAAADLVKVKQLENHTVFIIGQCMVVFIGDKKAAVVCQAGVAKPLYIGGNMVHYDSRGTYNLVSGTFVLSEFPEWSQIFTPICVLPCGLLLCKSATRWMLINVATNTIKEVAAEGDYLVDDYGARRERIPADYAGPYLPHFHVGGLCCCLGGGIAAS